MQRKVHLFWIVPTALLGAIVAILVVLVGLCAVPSVRQKILNEGVRKASEITGYDIAIQRVYLSPFHQSPASIFRDSVVIEIDSLFIGHAKQDTLVYLHHFSVSALPLAMDKSPFSIHLRDTIEVHHLTLEDAVIHTDSLIEACKIDADVHRLHLISPGIVLTQGKYPLHHLQLHDADIAITLNDTPIDTAQTDTTALLMAFDVPDGELNHVHFCLQPMGLDIQTQSLRTCALADVGGEVYAVPSIQLGPTVIGLGDLRIPLDTVDGDAHVDLAQQLITTQGLHLACDSLDAKVDVNNTHFDMETMQVDFAVRASMQDNAAQAQGSYNINTETYQVHAELEQVNLAPWVDSATHICLAGTIDAEGQGLDFKSHRTHSHVKIDLPTCVYNQWEASGIRLDADLARQVVSGQLHLPVTGDEKDLSVQAESEHQFRVAKVFSAQPQVDYHAQMRHIQAHAMGNDFATPFIDIDFQTDSITDCHLSSQELDLTLHSPQHLITFLQDLQPLVTAVSDTTLVAAIASCKNLPMIDTLRHLVPPVDAQIQVNRNSIAQPILERYGLDINHFDLSLHSDSGRTSLLTNVSMPALEHPDTSYVRLPAVDAQLQVVLQPSTTDLSLTSSALVTDGMMSVHDLCSQVDMQTHIHRHEHELSGNGTIVLNNTSMGNTDLGNRTLDFTIEPSKDYPQGAFMLRARLDDIPLDLVDSILKQPDIDLSGHIRTHATLDGLPSAMDISAQVLPVGVKARYQPLEAELALGEVPITMAHNHIQLNGLPIYGVDSSSLRLFGGLNIDSLNLDVTLEADSFAPLRLVKNGPIPVYGDFAAAIHGRMSGPLTHIVTDADVTILPVTNLTYPIDKKNLAQVSPEGTVQIHYADSLELGGEIRINDGVVKYSPKAYPMMPFRVDSGSYVRFHGPVGATELAVSASQHIKADVQAANEESRRVAFNTGVRINGVVDSVGIHSIGFFLEAPHDEEVTQELATMDEDMRDGLAATLLATGMYVGESNVAAQKDGYALSSIVNNKINAAMANSKLGNVVDIDLSSGEKIHGNNTKTQDLGLTISKSFLNDRFRITVGTSLSDNPEVNKTSSLLNNLSADYKITKSGSVLLRLFSQRDYNNVLEGELYKSGLGIRAQKDWKKPTRRDSLMYTYSLVGDCNVAYRSNNSIGPDAALTFAIRNLWGKGEALSIKWKGAYYWSLLKRHSNDPKNKNTYKLGGDIALTFPYLHWSGDNNPDGNTRYIIGYQHENIAGGYAVHKYSASFSYFIRSGQFITHSFTPFSLSVVQMYAADANLMDKTADYPQLIAVLAGDEFVPSISYGFTYDNYRSKRAVNTYFDWDIKESGNIINGIFCAFGQSWNKKGKKIGQVTFDQFIKTNVELHNKFNLTPTVCFATRLYAGVAIPLGTSDFTPLSEKYYAGGPNSLRAASPYAYGPGNFYSPKYNQSFFHAGDIRLEANIELRFPIIWKLSGAVFADVGNVWNWVDTWDAAEATGQTHLVQKFGITDQLEDGFRVKNLGKQLAFGTGFGLRLDIESIVIRLDLGVAIHSPYQTYKYDKKGNVTDTPITSYYNIPSALDGLRLNFGIGYPF